MSYETLDKIADSYIPILILLSMISVFSCIKMSFSLSVRRMVFLSLLVLMVYLVMYVDSYFGLWAGIRGGLDYSTHTALSLVLVLFLGNCHKNSRIALGLVFIGYLLLMLYQQYHTVLDILSTGFVVGLLAALIAKPVGGFRLRHAIQHFPETLEAETYGPRKSN